MKTSNLLKLSLLAVSALSLASCGLSNLTSSSNNSDATTTTSTSTNLTSADEQLVNNINAGLLSNETLASYLKSPTVSSYVKNAISLVLAKKYISQNNVELANKYLTYFNLAQATTSQAGIFNQLKGLLGK